MALHEKRGTLGKRRRVRERISYRDLGTVQRSEPGQRGERQAEPDRRVARRQEQALAAEAPALSDPAPAAILRLPDLDRQHVTGRRAEPALEHAHEARALG